MIIRLTAAATAFAILATGSLALAANGRAPDSTAPTSAAKTITVIHLPLVVVVGTRTPAAAR
ncbi:MAG: hypothetical protein ABIX46_00260 [Burkholderiaceae bacterium]